VKKDEKLNTVTPHWFRDWHVEHFKPVKGRTLRNERWIYIILVAILGSSVLTNGNADEMIRIITNLIGG